MLLRPNLAVSLSVLYVVIKFSSQNPRTCHPMPCRSQIHRDAKKLSKDAAFNRYFVESILDLSGGRRDDRGHVKAGPEHVCAKENTAKSQQTDSSLGSRGVVLAHGAQLESCIDKGGLKLLCAELVVAQTGQGDRVSEVLLESNRVLEDDEGGNHEEDIFENTRHSKDDR